MAWLQRSGASATVAGAVVLLACGPATAEAQVRDVPSAGPLAVGSAPGHVRDMVLAREAPTMRVARAGTRTRSLSSPDGYRVELEVSSSYADDPAADQAIVDFLASRLHGPELGSLRVYVGTPRQIARLCGGDPLTVACYAIDEARMYVPGEEVDGIPVEYPLTHEYGHHLASARSNNPWDALDWGAKHWASATRVCAHVKRGELFPGDQGEHYFDDPGEGFADGYAHLHYPAVPWQYNELMRPGPSTFAAIRRDVVRPWAGNRSRTFRGRLGPGQAARTFSIRLTLDGDVTLRLTAPRGASYTVEAETNGFGAGRVLRSGGSFGVEWCRRRPAERVTLTVRRLDGERAARASVRHPGHGPFALTASWPG